MRQSTSTMSSIGGTMTREPWLSMCFMTQPDVWALDVWLPCFTLTCKLLSALVAESGVCHRPGTASDMPSLTADIPTCTLAGTPQSGRQTLPSQQKPGFPGKRSQLKVCPAIAAHTRCPAQQHIHDVLHSSTYTMSCTAAHTRCPTQQHACWLHSSSVKSLGHFVLLGWHNALLCCAAASFLP